MPPLRDTHVHFKRRRNAPLLSIVSRPFYKRLTYPIPKEHNLRHPALMDKPRSARTRDESLPNIQPNSDHIHCRSGVGSYRAFRTGYRPVPDSTTLSVMPIIRSVREISTHTVGCLSNRCGYLISPPQTNRSRLTQSDQNSSARTGEEARHKSLPRAANRWYKSIPSVGVSRWLCVFVCGRFC